MTQRKMHVQVTVDVFIVADDTIELQKIMDDMDYSFSSNTEGATVEDTSMETFELTNSR
jgi:hypothetical protein